MPANLFPWREQIREDLRTVLKGGQLSLRLPEEIEEAYERDSTCWRVAHYRLSMLTGILLYDLFLGMDYISLHSMYWLSAVVRLGIATPLALVLIWLVPRLKRRAREILYAYSVLPALLGVLYLYRGSEELVVGSQATIFIIMLYSVHALRPSFRYAVSSLVSFTLCDVLFLIEGGKLNPAQTMLFISLAATAALLSLVASYGMERKARASFLLQLRYEEQNRELAMVNDELARLTMTDALTGIPNRRAFAVELRTAWERCQLTHQPLAALMIDLDNFKEFNDHYGHSYGDTVLRVVALTLRDTLRSERDFAARYGGEEFVALLPGEFLAEARAVAERLCSAVREAKLPLVEGRQPQVTVSIGVASVLPTPRRGSADLLRMADAALYEAKSYGRDRVCVAGSSDSAMPAAGELSGKV